MSLTNASYNKSWQEIWAFFHIVNNADGGKGGETVAGIVCEGSREERGSSTGKDQKGQMNDSKMMREMRGKKTRWEREEVRNTDQVSEPKTPHFRHVNQINSEGKSSPKRIDSSQTNINPEWALGAGVIP